MNGFLASGQGNLPVFTVERRVITTPEGQAHGFTTMRMEVHAPTAAEAASLANDNKYAREVGLGHHGRDARCC